jgi:hypothetical protein
MRTSVGLCAVAVVGIAFGAAVAGTGCNQPSYVTRDRFSQDYAQALCTALQPCCQQNQVSFDYATCTKGWKAQIDQLLASTPNYDIGSATQCIQMVQGAAGASCQGGPGTLTDARTTCQQIFAGQTPPGGPCTSAAQCQQMAGSIVVCAVPQSEGGADAGSVGQLPLADPEPRLVPLDVPVDLENGPVCVVEAPGDAGMPSCTSDVEAGTDSWFMAGTYCDPMMKVCMPTGAAGAPCDPAVVASCQPGNYCVRGGMANATCAAANPQGSPCTSSVQCDATSLCSTMSHTCVAREQAGQSCTSGSQCSIGVCDTTTHKCLANPLGTTQACSG